MQKLSGFVPIIGAPNAGKSTLLNAVLGQKLSIVTAKPQTTRNKITGIYTKDNVQIVFVDTPGILDPKYKLQQFMSREIESSIIESDIIILVVDIKKYDRESFGKLYGKYSKEYKGHKLFCVLNKIDLIRKEDILSVIKDLSDNFKIDEIIPVSAVKGFNVDELLKTIIKYLPENEFYFESEVLTAQPEKFFVSEIIRQNVLRQYKDEIPFSVYIDIEEFKERENGKDFIRAAVMVERETQRAIIIGEGGLKIKKLGEYSRRSIEDFLGRPVYLELFVKVRKDWKNDDDFLKRNFNKFGSSVT
ncbi:MAG TPA: GTPase Era [Ignavibacteria bacterium]|nr:GTPase Era [Ignavibacteria bacterium]HMR00105.1 GTPase Era [Ignavibacteria bacterium]